MTATPVLYKYESINEYSLRNLKNAQIFFNAPSSFNDPFDCSLNEASFICEDGDFVELYNYMRNKGVLGDVEPVNNVGGLPADFIKKCLAGFTGSISEIENRQLHKLGCTCFSKTNNHILMWAHYANGHKGMCLEFDATKAPFNGAFEVTYSEKFPPINPIKILTNSVEILNREAVKPLLTKYECWKYEEEWRLFHKEPNKLYGYEVDALKAVYFGTDVILTDLEIVCLILQGQNENIQFFKANKSKANYSLEFEHFSYTPYIKKP